MSIRILSVEFTWEENYIKNDSHGESTRIPGPYNLLISK